MNQNTQRESQNTQRNTLARWQGDPGVHAVSPSSARFVDVVQAQLVLVVVRFRPTIVYAIVEVLRRRFGKCLSVRVERCDVGAVRLVGVLQELRARHVVLVREQAVLPVLAADLAGQVATLKACAACGGASDERLPHALASATALAS